MPRPTSKFIARTLALAAVFCLIRAAAAQEIPAGALFPLTDVAVLDGDTIRADVRLPYSITLEDREIRAADYDAAESSRRRKTVKVTDEEIVRGKAATAALKELLAREPRLFVQPPTGKGQDVYGRLLGTFYVWRRDGTWLPLADFMRQGGFLR